MQTSSSYFHFPPALTDLHVLSDPPDWSASSLPLRPRSERNLCGFRRQRDSPDRTRAQPKSHGYFPNISFLRTVNFLLYGRFSLTLSFQQTDVTESPSTDRSHNLVTCKDKHKVHTFTISNFLFSRSDRLYFFSYRRQLTTETSPQ